MFLSQKIQYRSGNRDESCLKHPKENGVTPRSNRCGSGCIRWHVGAVRWYSSCSRVSIGSVGVSRYLGLRSLRVVDEIQKFKMTKYVAPPQTGARPNALAVRSQFFVPRPLAQRNIQHRSTVGWPHNSTTTVVFLRNIAEWRRNSKCLNVPVREKRHMRCKAGEAKGQGTVSKLW